MKQTLTVTMETSPGPCGQGVLTLADGMGPQVGDEGDGKAGAEVRIMEW